MCAQKNLKSLKDQLQFDLRVIRPWTVDPQRAVKLSKKKVFNFEFELFFFQFDEFLIFLRRTFVTGRYIFIPRGARVSRKNFKSSSPK